MMCPICSGVAHVFTKRGDYEIAACESCGLHFSHPMPTDEQLASVYSGYSDPLAEVDVVRANSASRYKKLQSRGLLAEHDNVLDFGSGCNVLPPPIDAEFCAFDPYLIPGSKMPDGKLDLITMWGVLEHLTSPLETMKELAQHLAPGGHMAITTVSLDADIPLRYKPPEHTLYFSDMSLFVLAERCGLVVKSIEPYTMIQRSSVYVDVLLRTMPEMYREGVHVCLPEFVEIPTNEVFVVLTNP